jgi:ADP-heptose:LPS heptosyltransferase
LPQYYLSFVLVVKFELTMAKCYIFELSMSMKQLDRHSSNTVRARSCVIFPGALGDFICFLPALQTLVRDSEIDLFARSEFAEIVTSEVSVRSLESHEVSRLFTADIAEEQSLQNFFGAYAAVYSWLGSRQSDFVQRLRSLSGGRAQIFPFQPNGRETHQIDYYLGCLRRHGAVARQPQVELRPDEIAWCAHFWAAHELHRRPVLVIASGSGAREKNWPEEFFLAVVEWWRQAVSGAVVLLTGPVEEERGGTDRLRGGCIVASDLTLSRAAALLARCDVYLGNDSGITHLAAAAGIRTVALFGPSNVRQWAPRGRRVTIISRNIECSPCQIPMMKSCPHHTCLTELHPKDVIGVMADLPEIVTLTRMGAGIKV